MKFNYNDFHMWVPTEAAAVKTDPAAEKSPAKKIELNLTSILEKQRAMERKINPSIKERAAIAKELMGQKDRDISGRTTSTYANVLATEFMSLNAARELAGRNGQDFPQKDQGWQASFINNFLHEFAKKNPDFKFDSANRDQMYAACFAAAEDLLMSEDPDEKELWLTNAMVATKRQMLALQVATGAEIDVRQEADEIEDVADVQAMSALLAEESGVPLEQIQTDMSRLGKFFKNVEVKRSKSLITINLPTGNALTLQVPNIRGKDFILPLTRAFLRSSYMGRPGQKVHLEDNEQILNMLDQYAQESGKRIHSNIKVRFEDEGEVNYARPYYIGDPGNPQNRRQLDEVQRAYLQNLPRIGRVEQGDNLKLLSKREARRLLTSMAAAQQDFMFAKFSVQERSAEDFNMIKRTPDGRILLTASPQGNIIPRIEGARPMPVGTNEGNYSLDAQLTFVNSQIEERVKAEIRDTTGIEQILKDVNEELYEVGERRSHEQDGNKVDKRNKAQAEEAILVNKKTEIDKHTILEEQIAGIDKTISTLEAQATDGITLKREIETAENEIEQSKKEQQEKEDEKAKRQQEIQGKKDKIGEINGNVHALTELVNKLDQQHDVDEARSQLLPNEISSLESWLNAYNGNQNNGGYRTKSELFLKLKEEEKAINTRNALYTQKRDALTQQKTALQNQIRNSSANTGLEVEMDALEKEISGTGGLNEKIADETTKQLTKTTEIEQKQAALEKYQSTLDEIEAKKQEKAKKEKELFEQATRIAAAYNNLQPTDYAATLTTLETDIKAKQTEISQLQAELDMESLALDYKSEVLEAAKKHILHKNAWNAIQERARKPLTEISGAAKLGQRDMLTEINLACEQRPQALPAFIRTMGVLGGSEALQNTPEGKRIYDELSKVVTPELWFSVFKNRNEALLANAMNLGVTLPKDLTIYDSRLQDPDIKRLMFRQVDRRFINDLLNEVLARAANKNPDKPQLGVLTPDEVELYKAIAVESPSVDGESLSKERKVYDAQVDTAKIKYQWAVDERRREAVDFIETYATTTLGLQPDRVSALLRAVRTAKMTADISDRVLTAGNFAPHQADILAAFQQEGFTYTNAEMIGIMNTVGSLNIDVRDLAEAYPPLPDTVVTAAQLDAAHTQDILTGVRQFLVDNKLSPPITDTEFNKQINGTSVYDQLRQIIEDKNAATLPTTFGEPEAKQFIKDITEVTASAKEYVSITDDVLKDFMLGGGSDRDGIWLSLILADSDTEVATQIKDALYTLKMQKEKRTLENVTNNVSSKYKGMIENTLNKLKDDAEMLIATNRGVAVADIDVDDESIIDDIELGRNYAANTLLRSRSWNPRMSGQPVLISEASAFNALLEPELKRSSLEKDIKHYDKQFWGLQGAELIVAIERELGGQSQRNEAIKFAKEISKRRGVPIN